MNITLCSIVVDDQGKALRFYTEVLGFLKKVDLPAGEYRWLTVVSPDAPNGTQLVLEPNANPASRSYQRALHDGGIPLTAFEVADIGKEYARLKELGVKFTMQPTKTPGPTIAVFDDTCGNLIQIYQV